MVLSSVSRNCGLFTQSIAICLYHYLFEAHAFFAFASIVFLWGNFGQFHGIVSKFSSSFLWGITRVINKYYLHPSYSLRKLDCFLKSTSALVFCIVGLPSTVLQIFHSTEIYKTLNIYVLQFSLQTYLVKLVLEMKGNEVFIIFDIDL